ncbi:MAG TPA: hypothetical protein VFT37_12170 [Telluria sp.]|nr:hypothetical protein [Telluria sp.]
MSNQWLVFGLLACAPLAVAAQQLQQQGPLDPTAAVPAVTYRSVFAAPAPATEAATPDKEWRAANATVAQTGDAHAHHGAPQDAATASPAAPAAPTAPAAPAAPDAPPAKPAAPVKHDHHKHEGK